jgi:hypothetical protein
MQKISGFSAQNEDIRDGTGPLQKIPSPGPIGKHSTAHHSAFNPYSRNVASRKISSIQKTQLAIRQRIKEIKTPLDEEAVPQSQSWKRLKISSFKDLQSDFSARWEGLMKDIQTLREHLQDLVRETERFRPDSESSVSLSSMGDDFERLLLNAQKTGKLDPSQLENLRVMSEQHVASWTAVVQANPSLDSMKDLVAHLGVACHLGQSSEVTQDGWVALKDAASKLTQSAEKQFRDNPTTKNFQDYYEKALISLKVGGDGPTLDIPAGVKRLRPDENVYVVKPGDSLSSISTRFYGTPSFWDVIYMLNRKEIGDNPDRLAPNLKLEVP